MNQCRIVQREFKHFPGDPLFISLEPHCNYKVPSAFGFSIPEESHNHTSHYAVKEHRISNSHFKQYENLIMHNSDDRSKDKPEHRKSLKYHAGTANSPSPELIYYAIDDSSNQPTSSDQEEEDKYENRLASSSSYPNDGNDIDFGNLDFEVLENHINDPSRDQSDGVGNNVIDPHLKFNDSFKNSLQGVREDLDDASMLPDGRHKNHEGAIYCADTVPNIAAVYPSNIGPCYESSCTPSGYMEALPQYHPYAANNQRSTNNGDGRVHDSKRRAKSMKNEIVNFIRASNRKSNARYTPIEDIAIRYRKANGVPWKHVFLKRRKGSNLQVHLSQTLNKTKYPNPDILNDEEMELLTTLVEEGIETFLSSIPKIGLKSTGAHIPRKVYESIYDLFMDCKILELDMLYNGKDFSSDSDSSDQE